MNFPHSAILFFPAIVLVTAGCANKATTPTWTIGIYSPGPCPPALPAVPLKPPVVTVGAGTPASCTEQALRIAIDSLGKLSNGGSIAFNCGSSPATIVLTKSLDVKGTAIIDGNGLITLSGNGVVRVIDAANYADLTVQRLTIADGRADSSGAGIQCPWFGSLILIDVMFRNNICTVKGPEFGGGAVFAGGLRHTIVSGCTFAGNRASNGGAILNRSSSLRIVRSRFENDTAFGTGGGRDAGPGGQGGLGGAVYVDGVCVYPDTAESLAIYGCSFAGNLTHQHGSAVFSYFYANQRSHIQDCEFDSNYVNGDTTGSATLYHENAPLYLANCTFADNRTDLHAGALFVGSHSSATLVNCTFFHNVVPQVGAALFAGTQPVTVINCTFAANNADYGPAIYTEDVHAITIYNSIFAGNTTANQYSNLSCTYTATAGSGSIQWPAVKLSGHADLPCTYSILFADPLLKPPADNGGLTRTMALDPSSPAIGIGSDCIATDQRGAARTKPCDAGAYEHD